MRPPDVVARACSRSRSDCSRMGLVIAPDGASARDQHRLDFEDVARARGLCEILARRKRPARRRVDERVIRVGGSVQLSTAAWMMSAPVLPGSRSNSARRVWSAVRT